MKKGPKVTKLSGVLFVYFLFCSVSYNFYEKSSVVCNSLGGTTYKFDPASVVLNPACVNYNERTNFSASYTYLDENVRFNSLVYSDDFGKVNFSILFSQVYQDNLFVRHNITDEGIPTYMNKLFGLLTVGSSFYGFDVAGSLKTVYYDIYDTKSNISFGVDLGVMKKIFEKGNLLRNKLSVYCGAAITNILGPNVKIGSETEKYSLTARISTSFELSLWPRYNFKKEKLSYDSLGLLLDYSFETLDTFDTSNFSYGLQYRRENIFVRVGYNPDTFKKVSFGLGANFGNVSLNYGFIPFVDIGIHSLSFCYFWGEKKVSEVSRVSGVSEVSEELEDFLQIQKKALRIAEKYSRDAEDLVKSKKYESALSLLERIYPLSKDYSKIEELINISKNAVISESSNKVSNEYNKDISIGDYISAYDEVLSAVDKLTETQLAQQILEDFNKKVVPLYAITVITNKKNMFVEQIKNNIRQMVEEYNFENAKTELKKLQLLSYDDYVEQKNYVDKTISQFSKELVQKAMNFFKQKNYNYSYFYLKEAYRISNDENIKLQLKQVEDKLKKPDLYDEVYHKKLFYLACIYFALEEYQNAKQTFFELRSKHPNFDYDLLLEMLRKKKVISLQELLP